MNWKVGEENVRDVQIMEDELNFIEDPETFKRQYYGRLSPFAKENLYREYLKGATVKKLSLKYGVLQQRVKAIVW